MSVSSRAELGNLGFDPSHLSFVPSSPGRGRNDNVDTTVLEFDEFDIWNEAIFGNFRADSTLINNKFNFVSN